MGGGVVGEQTCGLGQTKRDDPVQVEPAERATSGQIVQKYRQPVTLGVTLVKDFIYFTCSLSLKIQILTF